MHFVSAGGLALSVGEIILKSDSAFTTSAQQIVLKKIFKFFHLTDPHNSKLLNYLLELYLKVSSWKEVDILP